MPTNIQIKNLKTIPTHGFISEIAKTFNCHRTTVSNALFKNQKGILSEKIREYFRKKYCNE